MIKNTQQHTTLFTNVKCDRVNKYAHKNLSKLNTSKYRNISVEHTQNSAAKLRIPL